MQTGRGGRCSGGSRFARTAKRVHSSPHLISSSASLNLPTHSPALSLFLVHRSYFNFAKTTEFQWPNGLLKKATLKFIEERNYDTVAGGSGFLSFFPFFSPSDWPFLQMRKSEKCLFLWATPSASEP